MALGKSPDNYSADGLYRRPQSAFNAPKKSLVAGILMGTSVLIAQIPTHAKAEAPGAIPTSALAAPVSSPAGVEGSSAPHDGHLNEITDVEHVHYDNHFTVGVEGGPHGLMAKTGVFHEVAPHLSVGLVAGAGSTLNGMPTGLAEIMAAYHKTIRGKVFAVVEAGGGVDFYRGEHGVHTSPLGKVTGLVGYQASPDVGVFAGPSLAVNSHGDPSGSVSVGTVVEF